LPNGILCLEHADGKLYLQGRTVFVDTPYVCGVFCFALEWRIRGDPKLEAKALSP
jgi:hypothetical protein